VDDTKRFTIVEGATLSLLLALASIVLVGYRFGDSNHGITVPILKRLMDPSLYPGDVMVATADRFPTLFYRGLALLLPSTQWIPASFFALYVASIAATYAGAYRIGAFFGGPKAGAFALAFAFPVRIGMAGEALYRVAFSHSHVASAITIWAIVWFLEGRRLLPILVLALDGYVHVLYSAYVLVPVLLVVLVERRSAGLRRTALLLAAAVVPLLPLAAWSLAHAHPMTPEWLALLRLRSSHHSFPSAFGADLPEAAALLALAALAVSRLDARKRGLFALFLVGTALQFAAGTLFTELHPLKVVLQYQPHRSWRFMLLLVQGAIAADVAQGLAASGWARVSALVTGVLVFVPGLESLLPIAVVAQAFAARPLPAAWARLTAALVLVITPGWGDKAVDFGGFLGDLLLHVPNTGPLRAAALALLVAIGLAAAPGVRRRLAWAALALCVLWLGPDCYARARDRWEAGDWRDVQDWVRAHTPKDAVLLTPPRESGFRVFSERTVVGEWKDGTQQYFDDAFVREWGARMDALRDLPRRDADELLSLARLYGASEIVLPASRHPRLVELYRNGSYAVYRAAHAPQ
jgi:Domain of unknown function (DUF6798)